MQGLDEKNRILLRFFVYDVWGGNYGITNIIFS